MARVQACAKNRWIGQGSGAGSARLRGPALPARAL